MADAITLRVITPEEIILDTQAERVRVPGLDGSIGILRRHAPMVAALDAGELRYEQGGRDESMFVGQGFAEVRDNTVRIVSDACERPTDIDVERAKRAAERAKERLRTRKVEGADEFDALRAEASLRRPIQRLRVSEYSG